MTAHCQIFARHASLYPIHGKFQMPNFFLIRPENERCALPCHNLVMMLARRLSYRGFVHVALSGLEETENHALGVRYLPLGLPFPSFGALAAVIVFNEEEWARKAASQYSDTDVFLIHVDEGKGSQESLARSVSHILDSLGLPRVGDRQKRARGVSANGSSVTGRSADCG